MKFGMRLSGIAVCLAFTVSLWSGPTRAGEKDQEKDIVAVVKATGKHKTLAKLLEATKLDKRLQEKGPYTLFAPTDAAFAKLPKETLEKLLKEEGTKTLKQLLLYHVAEGKQTTKSFGGKNVKTLTGKEIFCPILMNEIELNFKGHITTPDVPAANGLVQVIDLVLMPNDEDKK